MTDDSEKPQLTRRETLAAGGAIPAAAVGFPGADWFAVDSHLTAFAATHVGPRGNFSTRDKTVMHSGDRPSVHIPYGEAQRASLIEWIDADDNRELLRENDVINTATVIINRGDIAGPQWNPPSLADVDWVDGAVGMNTQVSIPEPVDLASEADWSPVSGLEEWAMQIYGSGPPGSDGVAFDDAPEGSISAARDVTGAGDAEDFWSTADTSTVTVAVIDTGFNTSGGDILNNTNRILDASKSFITGDTVGNNGLDAVGDGQGHGTHVASTICADPPDSAYSDYKGYLPSADLLVLKALGDDGSGSTADIAKAITYAADNGADVMCLSLGSPVWNIELERALSYAAGANVIPFVAAGNDRQGSRWASSPADNEYVMCIAAGTIETPENAQTAYFSNIGPDPGTTDSSDGATTNAGPHFVAPGMELTALTANTSGDLAETTLSGTSMATPCVTGAAGLVLSEADVEQDLKTMIETLSSYSNPAPKIGIHEGGAGYPDVAATIADNTDDSLDGDDRWTLHSASLAVSGDDRNSDAESRDQSWEALSDVHGRRLTRWLV